MSHIQQVLDKEHQESRITQPLVSEPITVLIVISEAIEEEQLNGEAETAVIEGEVIEIPMPKIPIYKRPVPLKWMIFIATSMLLISILVMLFALPLLTTSATVLIVPDEKTVTANVTFRLANAHILAPLTLSQAKTIPTTGTGHQDATQARGTVTFYNAAPFPQSIDAGTLLIGTDGVHVVTDETAIIPAGNAPIEGQVTIWGHAINAGSQGNIAAFDISEECCRDYVFVKNLSAFTGGMDARDYKMVRQDDVDTASSMLKTSLVQRIQNSFTSQLLPDEALTPPLCSQKMTADHAVGQVGATVTVTITDTCTATAYNVKAFTVQLRNAFVALSTHRIGTGYAVKGNLQTSLGNTTVHSGVVTITARCTGNLVYQFSKLEKGTIARLIAGKDRLQAVSILSHIRGVDQATINISRQGASLPTDTTHLSIVVLMRGS